MSQKLASTSVWRGGSSTKKVSRTETGGDPVRLIAREGKVVVFFSISSGKGWSNIEVHIDKADYRAVVDAMFESLMS